MEKVNMELPAGERISNGGLVASPSLSKSPLEEEYNSQLIPAGGASGD